MKKILCFLLVLLMTMGTASAGLASGEPEEAIPEEAVSEEAVSEEAVSEEAVPEEAVPEETVAREAAYEEAVSEAAAQAAILPEEAGEEAPAEEPLLADDPLDPSNAWARPQLDGASYGSWYDAFVTRELKNETLRQGIDVSSWQGTVNWTKVADAGVEFVIIRAAYRGTTSGTLNTDGRFLDYIRGAKAAGLLVGVYVFSQAITDEEAVEEADYILELVKDYEIDLPLVFDLEHYSGGRFSKAGLDQRAVTDMCLAFCRRVEEAGYESMVYSNPSMLNHDMYAQELGRLWLANYTKQTSYTARDYEYWQCSDIGDVDGISGYVDLDFWFQPGQGGDPFRDVKPEAWYYNVVMQAYREGLVNGMTRYTFVPGGTATRGQVVTMLHRLAGAPPWTAEASFTDLTQGYYRDAVYWAAENRVVNGYSEKEFRPDRAITREELVTLLYRMAGEPVPIGDVAGFTDAGSVQSWALDAMRWAVYNGIVTGYGDDTVRPGANATRAEVCAILTRYAALPAPIPDDSGAEETDDSGAEETDAPAEGTDTSAEGTDTPTEGTDTPTEGTDTPTEETGDKPAEEASAPAAPESPGN